MIPAVTLDRPVHKSQATRKARGGVFLGLAILATTLGVAVLAVLLITVTRDGIGVLTTLRWTAEASLHSQGSGR